jgi:hypothetical protein
MMSFEQYFETRKEKAFQKMGEMKIPKDDDNEIDRNEVQKYWNKSPKLLDDFRKLKNPNGLPQISPIFLQYIFECLDNTDTHSPINYTTKSGKESFSHASPEIIEGVWVDMKSAIVWYDQLVADGYYLSE